MGSYLKVTELCLNKMLNRILESGTRNLEP
jgi:hypothetical protein